MSTTGASGAPTSGTGTGTGTSTLLARAVGVRAVYGGGDRDFTAVDGVTLELGEGEILGLAGSRGAARPPWATPWP